MKKIIFALVAVLGLSWALYSKHSNQDAQEADSQPVPSIVREAGVDSSTRATSSSVGKGGTDEAGSAKPLTLEDLMASRYGNGWAIQRDGQDRIMNVMGGSIAGAGRGEQSILALATELAPYFMNNRPELARAVVADPGSELSKSFTVKQVAQGYEVFAGEIRVFARASDGAVYMINNDLKDVGNFSTTPRVLQDEARKRVIAHFQSRELSGLKFQNLLVWGNGTATELVWVFVATVKTPKFDKIQTFVGAQTGDIVFEQTMLAH